MSNTKLLCVVWTTLVFGLICCNHSSDPEPDGHGSAVINVSGSALSVADIERLQITVSGDGISPNIVVELPEGPEDHWSGTIADIPAGFNRTFLAEAFDSEGVLIYSGTATGVTINEGETVSISIYLQQTDPPEPFDNAVPVITSFTVSPMSASPADDVSLAVQAFDANPEDVLSFSWEAEDGTFSNSSSPSTIWTAPMTVGSYQVTIFVSDPHGSTATASATIVVSEAGAGDAEINIIINTSPELLGLVPTPTRIDEGESTSLDLTVNDPESDPLSFAWSADCDGTFDDASVEDSIFTLTTLTDDMCTLTVLITDDAGGSNQASITIETGPGVTPEEPIPPGCDGAIEFPDPALEAAIRDAIEIPIGDIYYEDVDSLTDLSANSLGISDLAKINCLNNLTSLYLGDNNINDVTPLSGLANLATLTLQQNNISDIAPLAGIINLTDLSIGSNSINDIRPLAGLKKLTTLYIREGGLVDITPLADLINLMELYLENNRITDISVLSSLADLRWLNLDNNDISDISPLAEITKLFFLRVTGNNIVDLSPLASLTELNILYLHNNSISDISALSNLSNLTGLHLGYNNISDISALSSLTNLTGLNLGYNSISDISILSGLIKLTGLDLHYNDISDISVCSGLTNLTRLSLNSNSISDISPLVLNSGLGNGDYIYITENLLNCDNPTTQSNIEELEGREVNLFHDCD